MTVETVEVSGWTGAVIGMRLPLATTKENAMEKSDGLGAKDLDLMKRLITADKDSTSQPNSKFMRMIHVQVCITAPMYWWKEFDTYKVGTTRNSSSTMHKLASEPINIDMFEMDDFEMIGGYIGTENFDINSTWLTLIERLEVLRQKYNETKDRRYWKELIRLLPSSFLQTSIVDLDYATLRNIYRWRKNHKLTEWHIFCNWIENLPYSELILLDNK